MAFIEMILEYSMNFMPMFLPVPLNTRDFLKRGIEMENRREMGSVKVETFGTNQGSS